jgi:transposase
MKKGTRFVGLDVHAETIAVAVAESGGEVRSVGTIPNRPEAIRRLVAKLGETKHLRVCYEAGPTGYVVYWQLTALGVKCEVIAPTLVPVRAGDRVKTDRRDAEKLARSYRSGDLTAVWVPDAAHEALRDLVRAREAAKKDQLRARHRLGKFLLRHGRRIPAGTRVWTQKHRKWLATVAFEQPAQQATLLDYITEADHAVDRIERLERAIDVAIESVPDSMRSVIDALQTLRGVAKMTAVTIVSEVGSLSRFAHPKQLMGYSGAVPSENSSGQRTRRGAITKTGNSHLRRVIVEAAWAYRHKPCVSTTLRLRQQGQREDVKAIAWKAQHRLWSRYWRLTSKSKPAQQIVTAIGRELLGFIWAIGTLVEGEATQPQKIRRAA